MGIAGFITCLYICYMAAVDINVKFQIFKKLYKLNKIFTLLPKIFAFLKKLFFVLARLNTKNQDKTFNYIKHR